MGLTIPADGQLRDLDPNSGECRLIPERGVVLVITDERGRESCFGFLKFPERIVDIHGKVLAETKLGNTWSFRDFQQTPDPRYRKIARMFADAGYLAGESDDYA